MPVLARHGGGILEAGPSAAAVGASTATEIVTAGNNVSGVLIHSISSRGTGEVLVESGSDQCLVLAGLYTAPFSFLIPAGNRLKITCAASADCRITYEIF
jgi:hypothetical protein